MKRLLVFGAIGAVLVCGCGIGLASWLWSRAAISTAGEVEFGNPLAIPPLAESEIDADGRRVFDLTAAAGRHDFGDGPVATWGFNGAYLGPTLRAARGEQVVINVHNDLAEPTTVHWHGMHLPARMDGGPHQPVAAGQTWSPSWRVDQPAATLWYHPHPHGETAEHVYRGLAGMFIVDDGTVEGLPDEYGVDDIPVIVQDKRFTGDGRLDRRGNLLGGGTQGDTIAVNGTVAPYLDVTTQRVRLRLLNASNTRVYQFGFADDRPFALVGTDGGLLDTPVEMSRVMLSAGERAELVVSMQPGERVVLRSTPPPLRLGFAPMERLLGGDDTFDVLELRAADRLAPSPELPDRLADLPEPRPTEVAETRRFHFSGRSINGQQMELGRVDATVVRDTTEVWQVSNDDGVIHNFHVHGVSFRVIAVDGEAPPPELRGWKDTLYLTPQVRFDLLVNFNSHADPETPYMFHCHVLAHEDEGMMGQFVVVEPGDQAAVTSPHDH
jgi:blue copper oxidase